MRRGEVVEGLKKGHPPLQLLPLLTEAQTFAAQRCQVLAQRQIEPFQQTRAQRQPQVSKPGGPAHEPILQSSKAPFDFLLDHLPIDQVGMGFQDRLGRGRPRLPVRAKALSW